MNKFQVGDLVKVKVYSHWKVGRIVKIDVDDDVLPFLIRGLNTVDDDWFHPDDLELAETPIQRMKRRYEEEV